jgi:cytochrome c-type biogenesis protein CcmH
VVQNLIREKFMKRLFNFLLLVFVSLIFANHALAQEPTPVPAGSVDPSTITDDQVNAIASQMYCPVCENIPLDVCPTQACAEWRELIRDKLAQGWTEEQIKAYFVQQFGDRVLAAPPAHGLNWLVYVIPPIAFLAGVYILYRALRSWRSPEPAAAQAISQAAPATDDQYVKRLEEELRKR